ncbi:MAG: hypothetical protein JNM17_35005, partial [Archangium sp.]|nr:hypothetical protein [Archangium sp.]
MLGLVMVAVVGSFDAVDGGFLAGTRVPVVHRTIEVFAPAQPGPVVVSDGDAPETKFPIFIEAATPPSVVDGGLLIDGTSLELTEPLTLQLKRAGSLSLSLGQPVTRRVGNKLYVDLPRASFALIPSTPFEELDGGVVRIVDPSATVDVQLQVSGPPISWPVLSAYQSWAGGMVWDAARARITRFGGGDEFAFEENTSIWDPIAGWQVLPIASPPPRIRTSLVYDSLRQRVVLFGGLGTNGLLADTWEFDGSRWIEVTPATSPPRRMAHAAAFDEDTGRMILFGGLAGPDITKLELGDTWSWDGFSWTQLQPAASPSARDSLAMTWDGTRRRVTLAAGWDGTNILADAWAWVGGSWQSLAPLPAPRTSAALVWSPVSHDLLLVGGWDPRLGPA